MQSKIDPISTATAFAAVMFGPELAYFIGPYAVILLASTTGAAWALGRQPPNPSRLWALFFFMRLNVMALLLTVPLAAIITKTFAIDDQTWLFAPIALFIGGIGDNWPAVFKWVLVRFGRLVERRTDTGDSK